MLYEGGIPFSVTREIPNKITLEAMKEAQEMLRSPEKYKKYDNVDRMMRTFWVMYEIVSSNQFRKDLKLAQKRG